MTKYDQKDVVGEHFNRDLLGKRTYSKQVSTWCWHWAYIVPVPRDSLIWHSCSYSTAIGWPESLHEVMNDTTASLKGVWRGLGRGMQSLCRAGSNLCCSCQARKMFVEWSPATRTHFAPLKG